MRFAQGFAWPALDNGLKKRDNRIRASAPRSSHRARPARRRDAACRSKMRLFVEVADWDGYTHAFEKGQRYLLHSHGRIRFLIITKLMQWRHATMPMEGQEENNSGACEASSRQALPPHRRVSSNKCVAGTYTSQTLGTTARPSTTEDPQLIVDVEEYTDSWFMPGIPG